MVYVGYAYRWETMRQDELYYPVGGMQKIPDAMASAIRKAGGEIRLRTEAVKILTEGGKASGVLLRQRRDFYWQDHYFKCFSAFHRKPPGCGHQGA